MASYPTPAPVTIDPMVPNQTYVDVVAAPLTDVRAPEAGEIMYVGDGTTAPFQGYAPGVILLYGQRSKMLHVFGFLDRNYVDHLRAGGIWGWTGGAKHDALLDPLVPDFVHKIEDTIHTPAQHPRPTVAEGALIGRVSPSRGRLRWSLMKFGAAAAVMSPLEWIQLNGLPAPAVKPAPGPAPAPPVEPSGGIGGLALLALAYFAMEEL